MTAPANGHAHQLTDADRELLVRIARDQAVKAVAAAFNAVFGYADLIRQATEHRLGIPASDEAALDDPTYHAILDVYLGLGEAKSRLAKIAPPADGAR